MRWIAALLMLCATARADIPMTCEQVRAQVALHGRAAALAWARRNGWSESQIAEARRCLRG